MPKVSAFGGTPLLRMSFSVSSTRLRSPEVHPNLPTHIVDFVGVDSSIVLILRGGILRPIGNFPESLTQAMLVRCNVNREMGRSTVGHVYVHLCVAAARTRGSI